MANATRQRLIETAYDLFSHHGFHAIGLDRIIDAVGVSKQTFYNHFESKDELILAVLEHRSVDELRLIDQLLDEHGGSDPRSRLYALLDVLDVWLNDAAFSGCIFITAAAEFSAQHDPAHEAACRHALAVRSMICNLAERAGADDPLELASQLLILIDGALTFRHVTGNLRAAKIAHGTAQLLLDSQLRPSGVEV